MTVSPPLVDALVCRLAGGLALLAGVAFSLCAVVVSRLPLGAGPDGLAAYAIPGTRHALEPAVVPVLGSIGLFAAAIGLLAFAVGRVPRSMFDREVGTRPTTRFQIRRQPLILLSGLAVLAAVLWLKA